MSISEILKYLLAAYPNANVNAATVAVYVDMLQDIPVDDLQLVAKQTIAECTFFPTVAELRTRWHTLRTQIGQTGTADAWNQVQREIGRIGSWGTPQFDDPLIKRAVDGMGWRNLCMSENAMADRAHFLKLYESLLQRQDQVNRLLPQAREYVAAQLTEGGQADRVRALIGVATPGQMN